MTVSVAVLGSGRVGRAIVRDLASDAEFVVTAADGSAEALAAATRLGAARTLSVDLGDLARVAHLAAQHDLVVGAVPGPIGYGVLEAVIEAGTDVVDISFFAEDPFNLDESARKSGVTAVVDCGVAPGLSNLLLGFAEATSDEVERFNCYVGGLPVDRSGPFQYKATFSPVDVIAEYVRPARYVEGGVTKTEPALSHVEPIVIDGVGVLEAFLTDGLRTLVRTASVPDMCEKTLRYPGHAEQMRLFRDAGFFDADPVDFGGVGIRPLDFTARLLEPLWTFQPGEPDLTALRVEIDSATGTVATRHVYNLVDRYDPVTDTSAMARTTGYTCAAVVRLVAGGRFKRKGICPPEYVGRDPACFESVVNDLQRRGIALEEAVSQLTA